MHKLNRWLNRWHSWIRATRGSVAVEFALIAPVLILIFFATVELARAIDCRTRVIEAAATAADLVAQRTSADADDIAAIACAVKSIIHPYSTNGTITLVITGLSCTSGSYSDSSCQTPQVDWSRYTSGASARTSAPSDLPKNTFISDSAGVVVAEITYSYTPQTTEFLSGPITMKKIAYAIPRNTTAVTGSNGTIDLSGCSISD